MRKGEKIEEPQDSKKGSWEEELKSEEIEGIQRMDIKEERITSYL